MENPSNIIRSWGLQQSFRISDGTVNKLAPPPYKSIKTLFCQTWREEQLSTSLDWGSQQFSVLLPESLRVISAAYLKIQIPSHALRAYPGLYCVKNVRLLSAGQELYNVEVSDFLSDYCSSLTSDEARTFADIYLGGRTAKTHQATVFVPIPTPNSAYMNRNGHDTRGHGVLPCFLGNQRLEFQITMNGNTFADSDGNGAVPSISGQCSIMYHEVQMEPRELELYADLRGSYNIISRRLQQLSGGWQDYASPNTEVSVNLSSPQGIVTQLIIFAVPTAASPDRYSAREYVKATNIRVTADAEPQLNLDDAHKCAVHLWTNGFVENELFPNAARICFRAHAGEDESHLYSGGYKMTLASNIVLSFTFAEAVKYRIVADQIQRIRCDGKGVFHATFD